MRGYTTISLSKAMKKKMFDIKCDLKMRSFDEVMEILLKSTKLSFELERGGITRWVSGVSLYDKLKDGWILKKYKIKGATEDEQPDQV